MTVLSLRLAGRVGDAPQLRLEDRRGARADRDQFLAVRQPRDLIREDPVAGDHALGTREGALQRGQVENVGLGEGHVGGGLSHVHDLHRMAGRQEIRDDEAADAARAAGDDDGRHQQAFTEARIDFQVLDGSKPMARLPCSISKGEALGFLR